MQSHSMCIIAMRSAEPGLKTTIWFPNVTSDHQLIYLGKQYTYIYIYIYL